MSELAPGRHDRVTFAVLAGGVSAYSLMQSLVVPVLSPMQRDLHTSQTTITWVLTAFLLSASVLTPIVGRIGDRIGKRRVYVATLALLALGTLLGGLADNIGMMIVARTIQGVGGGVLPLAFGIARDELPPAKVSGTVGLLAALTGVGGGAGIVLSGPIVNALDYHWLFWIPLVVVVLAAVAAHLLVPESPAGQADPISWPPAVLLSAWMVCLLLALSEGEVWGWGSARIAGLLVAAVLLGAAWAVVERRVAGPLIDLRMMARPAVWTTNLVALLTGFGMYSSFAFIPEFVQTPTSTGYGLGASPTRSGLLLLPSALAMFVVGSFAGRIGRRTSGKALVIVGSLISAGGYAILAFAHSADWEVYVATTVMGAGMGFAFSAMSALIVEAVPPEQTGVASGMNANIRTIGGSIGAALLTSVITAGAAADGWPREAGYTRGFTVLTVGAVLAAGAGALIPAVRRRVVEPGRTVPVGPVGPAVVDAELAARDEPG